MSDRTFESSFVFGEITHNTYRHTDASSGANYNFLAMLLDGTARIVNEAYTVTLEVGDVFFIPLGCRYHSYWYANDIVRWTSLGFIHFPTDRRYILQKLDADESVRERIQALGKRHRVDCESIGELYTLLGKLLPTMRPESDSPWQAVVDRAVQYMDTHPRAPLAEVAKHCSISESGLYAAFRSLGTTPALTRQQQQIDRAVTLITTTGLTADEIADRCGFSSCAYFLRVLKKHTGKTTREIRRSMEI